MNTVLQHNFDCIPGPTHQYHGLAHGNPHAEQSAGLVSNPRKAALQGLRKARALQDQGVPQALLPPHARPYLALLVKTGFLAMADIDNAVSADNFDALSRELERVAQAEPDLVGSCFSASSMWAANWATVTPSSDSLDGRCHFSTANLASNLHRAIEATHSASILRKIFSAANLFTVHEPLAANIAVMDEGAANHMRLCKKHGERGIHVFCYGIGGIRRVPADGPYVARQTRLASRAVAVQGAIPETMWMLVRQSDAAIASGVFHNDVIAMSNESLIICHEAAFDNQDLVRTRVIQWAADFGISLDWVQISEDQLSLSRSVQTYFFNSQIVRTHGDRTVLVCDNRCKSDHDVLQIVGSLIDKGQVSSVIYVDLEESLRNGGGPACVRLRVELNSVEVEAIKTYHGLNPTRGTWDRLERIINKSYPDQWGSGNIPSGQIIRQCFEATAEISTCLGI
ncbi:MAG: N-succinylarginine dihydrolase [Nitrospira sp.]|nr:N-succinylarginine dihydrolase [Nitrospira sp.]